MSKFIDQMIGSTLQNNKKAKLLIQYSGAPVNHVIAENKVKELYGGEEQMKQRDGVDDISDVFRSNVTPNDFVGSVLGYQGAGVNNSENVGEAMWESSKSFFRLFGAGDPSSHSYYPCVIGCGKDKFTPDLSHYYTPNQKDNQNKAQQPIGKYYKENFEVTRPDGAKEMTVDTNLLPIYNKDLGIAVDLKNANIKEEK